MSSENFQHKISQSCLLYLTCQILLWSRVFSGQVVCPQDFQSSHCATCDDSSGQKVCVSCQDGLVLRDGNCESSSSDQKRVIYWAFGAVGVIFILLLGLLIGRYLWKRKSAQSSGEQDRAESFWNRRRHKRRTSNKQMKEQLDRINTEVMIQKASSASPDFSSAATKEPIRDPRDLKDPESPEAVVVEIPPPQPPCEEEVPGQGAIPPVQPGEPMAGNSHPQQRRRSILKRHGRYSSESISVDASPHQPQGLVGNSNIPQSQP